MNLQGGPEIDRLFHALSDPTRRAILDRLTEAPSSVSELAAPLGITLTAVSQHLGVLQASGLARSEKTGRVRTCSLETAGFDRLQLWIDEHRNIWARRLDALAELLDEDETP
jgi:DNA-binding transcriptional ArsR family regulator